MINLMSCAGGRRNLGTGKIHVVQQVGIDAFQMPLLPGLDREWIKSLNHDALGLQAVGPDVLPEIERMLAVVEPVAVLGEGRLHFTADVFDALLNLRRWNEEADHPRQAEKWRRRAVRDVVLDPVTGWCSPTTFAAYVMLPSRDAASPAPTGIDSGLTFERYSQLNQAEPLFGGNRDWTDQTRRLGFSSHADDEATIGSAAFDT
jgi:hypothetical protein